MADGETEPPTSVTERPEEALELLAALEEAETRFATPSTSLASSRLKPQIQLLSRRLGFEAGRGRGG
jgi:hypothetical protein